MMICWAIALKVVDRRRAFLVLVMLALYPIFNFKGFKYNPDLLQLITLPLVVLAYLDAFDKRTLRSGVLLGLAGALALVTKYWVATMIGAVGLAALIHPARMLFLRSWAPWAAIVTMAAAMIPHFIWLREVNFVPFTYAGDTYAQSSRSENVQLVLTYIGHNLALLALPVALAAAAIAWRRRWWTLALLGHVTVVGIAGIGERPAGRPRSPKLRPATGLVVALALAVSVYAQSLPKTVIRPSSIAGTAYGDHFVSFWFRGSDLP